MAKEISMKEVRKHNNDNSLWIVIDNNVYDVTNYMDEHPGGADALLDQAGLDATQAFKDVGHSDDARTIMQKYHIGILQSAGTKPGACSNSKVRKPTTLDDESEEMIACFNDANMDKFPCRVPCPGDPNGALMLAQQCPSINPSSRPTACRRRLDLTREEIIAVIDGKDDETEFSRGSDGVDGHDWRTLAAIGAGLAVLAVVAIVVRKKMAGP